jgi:hypothetical protein
MTCKDCVYSPICKLYADFGVTDVPYEENDICKLFRSKIDFVEVVRCKNCKHFCKDLNDESCGICDAETSCCVTVDVNDFCSYGERRSEDENQSNTNQK